MQFLNRKLPSFYIVGVQKAGSNSLASYLDQHPDLYSSKQKETDYFIKYKDLKLSDYSKYFKYKLYWLDRQHTFESSVGYFYFDSIPQKIHQFNSDAKFILLLRHPVERAMSAWKMYQNFLVQKGKSSWNSLENVYQNYFNWLPADSRQNINALYESKIKNTPYQYFTEEISAIKSNGVSYSEPGFIEKGLYSVQLENYLQYFSIERFLIIDSAELSNHTAKTLSQITDFIGCRKIDWKTKDLTHRHRSESDLRLLESEFSKLRDFFRPYNERLFEIINKEFTWN